MKITRKDSHAGHRLADSRGWNTIGNTRRFTRILKASLYNVSRRKTWFWKVYVNGVIH